MPTAEVIQAMKVRFAAEEYSLGVAIDRSHLLEALRALRDQHGYRFYICATATDREESIEVLHGLRNLDTADELSVYEAGGVLQRFAQDFLEAGAAA